MRRERESKENACRVAVKLAGSLSGSEHFWSVGGSGMDQAMRLGGFLADVRIRGVAKHPLQSLLYAFDTEGFDLLDVKFVAYKGFAEDTGCRLRQVFVLPLEPGPENLDVLVAAVFIESQGS